MGRQLGQEGQGQGKDPSKLWQVASHLRCSLHHKLRPRSKMGTNQTQP